jgi:hypothetical protein
MTNMFPYNHLANLLVNPPVRRVTSVSISGPFGLFGPGFEHITHLHGPVWSMRKEDVVTSIRAGGLYYTDEDYGPRAYLEVVETSPFGGPSYVRTKADCTKTNNLLSLPRS